MILREEEEEGEEEEEEEALVVHDAEVAWYDFVLQHGAGWDVDPVSVVGDDDDGALDGGRVTGLGYNFFAWKKRSWMHIWGN